ncbi:tetratricopeptide repeat protein [Streptomyces sp. WI04-05B]|uniref:tetratricopeptide repeat protein n=1 Tax=Streptomyces TaxID=1883 RepID=UPI0029B33E45|nr:MULTISPECIES: tetratricopeptide repeat protein [unclassified Streptomyces]MDX2544457.1 tetratricopeptide repeat protein [Streptomyces sp. WI04-05B]MDX2588474.1 tetratricopeptide repeat protein [Streptomyces sp. WI04-05A]
MSGVAERFWSELRGLYEAAGSPSLSRLVKLGSVQQRPITISDATINGWLTAKSVPGKKSEQYFAVLIPFLQSRVSRESEYKRRSVYGWQQLLLAARQERTANQGGRPRTVESPTELSTSACGPVSLPPEPVGFTGRTGPLGNLLAQLGPDAGHPHGGPVTSAIVGMGGAGKTALAVHASHQARKRGWFPGGVLFADLRGYSSGGPQDPATTAEQFLRILGVPDSVIPTTPEGKLGLWRARLESLTESNKPLLVVLDNAAAAGQVSPLLPDSPHRVIVTSRHTLSALSAHRVELVALPIDEAVELLDQALRVTHPDDDRVVTHPGDAKSLAKLCGRLPLALHIIVALLRDEPDRLLASQIADLSDARMRLEILQYDDVDEQGRPLSLRAAFDLSYRQLVSGDGERARAFRLLALAPGPDFSVEIAAVLLGRPISIARRMVMDLTRVHLLEKRDGERWSMHDLLHLFADELARMHAEEDQRISVITRLFGHVLVATRSANKFLEVTSGDPVLERFTDRHAALNWLDSERECLVVAVAMAEEERHFDAAAQIALALSAFLNFRRHLQEWLETARVAVRSTSAIGNRHGQGTALNNLGLVLRQLRQLDGATSAHRQAAAIFQDLGDRQRQAGMLHNLGLDLQEARCFDESVGAFQQAVEISRELGDRLQEQKAWDAKGVSLQGLRQFDKAVDLHRRAASVFQEIGALGCEGGALTNLGVCLMELSCFRESLNAHRQAADIFGDLDDWYRRAAALDNQGAALQGLQEFGEAVSLHGQASAILRDYGDYHRLAGSLDNQGAAMQRMGRFYEALLIHQEAAEIFERFNDWHRRARALGNCGGALLKLRKFDESVDAYRKSADLYGESGDPYGMAQSGENLAIAHNERWRARFLISRSG